MLHLWEKIGHRDKPPDQEMSSTRSSFFSSDNMAVILMLGDVPMNLPSRWKPQDQDTSGDPSAFLQPPHAHFFRTSLYKLLSLDLKGVE